MEQKKLKSLTWGCALLRIFWAFVFIATVFTGLGIFGALKSVGIGSLRAEPMWWVLRILIFVLIGSAIFWIGIMLVYINSTQLGVRYRVWGAILGLIPIANLIMCFLIIHVVSTEVKTEKKRNRLNKARKDEEICKTKYPILFVHGVFFRDSEELCYWGRIPSELVKNGATVYYGNHNSASSCADSARELAERIRKIVKDTHCEKLNIIAHSKGGLDIRYAICHEGVSDLIASLTTINTPHRGCEFADYLLNKIPEREKNLIAKAYNSGAAKLGDINPDFLSSVYDLTSTSCAKFNEENPDSPGIYYQSFGSKLNRPTAGRFPLNLTYPLVHFFDGANDGLVGEKSFAWGEAYSYITTTGKRGISHADMIDLNRENFKGFDVREFYVDMVSKLRARGL